MQTIQMHLSEKPKCFSSIFQIYIKFSTFSEKDDPRSLCISKITDPEKRG